MSAEHALEVFLSNVLASKKERYLGFISGQKIAAKKAAEGISYDQLPRMAK